MLSAKWGPDEAMKCVSVQTFLCGKLSLVRKNLDITFFVSYKGLW